MQAEIIPFIKQQRGRASVDQAEECCRRDIVVALRIGRQPFYNFEEISLAAAAYRREQGQSGRDCEVIEDVSVQNPQRSANVFVRLEVNVFPEDMLNELSNIRLIGWCRAPRCPFSPLRSRHAAAEYREGRQDLVRAQPKGAKAPQWR